MIDSASLCCLTGRYDNTIPTRFLAPIDCSKIPAQYCNQLNSPAPSANFLLYVWQILDFLPVLANRGWTNRKRSWKKEAWDPSFHNLECFWEFSGTIINLPCTRSTVKNTLKSLFSAVSHLFTEETTLYDYRIILEAVQQSSYSYIMTVLIRPVPL